MLRLQAKLSIRSCPTYLHVCRLLCNSTHEESMNFSKLKLFTTIAGPAQKKPDNPETGNKNNKNVQLTNMLIIKLWKPCPEVEPSLSTVREDWRGSQQRGSEATTEG